jgi:hypothetical protein
MGGLPSFNRGIDLNVVHIVFGIYINVVNMEVSEGCPLIAVYTLCSLLRDYPECTNIWIRAYINICKWEHLE